MDGDGDNQDAINKHGFDNIHGSMVGYRLWEKMINGFTTFT
jgi:hypothetical protein